MPQSVGSMLKVTLYANFNLLLLNATFSGPATSSQWLIVRSVVDWLARQFKGLFQLWANFSLNGKDFSYLLMPRLVMKLGSHQLGTVFCCRAQVWATLAMAVLTVGLNYLKNRSEYWEKIFKQWSLMKSNSCGSSGSCNDSNLLRLFLTRVQFLKLPFLGNLWPL